MTVGPFWTLEKIAEMHRLVGQGFSASQIGRKLGCSRNAVIGKLHRVKVRAGVKPARKHPQSPYKSGSSKRKYTRRPKLETVVPPHEACGILDVTGCKWATGFDQSVIGRHVFCNRPRHDDRYCELHVEMSVASYSEELITKTVKRALEAHKAAA